SLLNRGNPFGASLVARSHYHPSSPRRLLQPRGGKVPQAGKCQPLEPGLRPAASHNSPGPAERLTAQGEVSEPGSTSSMEESWPSTESSSMLTPDGTLGGQDRAGSTGGSLQSRGTVRADTDWSESPKNAPMESSIIAKYIQRFRHGSPLSREDRERAASEHGTESTEFWWLMNSPPSSSTPTHDTNQFSQGSFGTEGGVFGNLSTSRLTQIGSLSGKMSLPGLPHPSVALLKSGLSSGGEPSDVSQLEPFDQETVHLQEKANRLLERSESSSSGRVPVSSEGVGSLSISDTIEEVSRRPTCIPLCKPAAGDVTMKQVPTVPDPLYSVRVPPFSALPGDDILYQWRLQRKMEAARERPWPLLPMRKSHSPPVRLDRQTEECDGVAPEDRMTVIVPSPENYWRGDETLAGASTMPAAGAALAKAGLKLSRTEPAAAELPPVPGPAPPQPAGGGHCSNPDMADRGQGQGGGGAMDRLPSQSFTEGGRQSAEGKPLGRVPHPRRSPSNPPEQRGHGYWWAHHKPRHNRDSQTDGTGPSTLERRRKPGDATPQQDLGQGSSSDEAWSPPASRHRVAMGHGARAGPPDCPAPSDVRRVLGQVVSERMFSPPASRQRTNNKTESRGRGVRLPPSPVPGTHQTPEAVSLLLEEAEESDGVEFEEDALLQVLRQQRDWVKQQLREANMRLTVLNDHER
ncbi:proline and serine-rich protein 3, partial [Cetorhinus maximus]